MSRGTAPALFPRGHRTTAMDIRPRQATGLRRHTTAMHLPRRYHHHPDLTDHLYRRLPRNPTGASRLGTPRFYRYITCLQTSFRGRFPSDWRTNGDSVGGSYLPSAFVGQPVGIDQVDDVWMGDSGATSHMTRTDLMYDTRPPPPTDLGLFWVMGRLRRYNSSENLT